MKTYTQRRLAGSYGLEIPDWDDAPNVGEMFDVNGKEFLVVDKQSLTKYTNGIFSGKPAWIQLRGFDPERDLP